MTALDAEEQAAEVYAGLVKRADELAWREDASAEALSGGVVGEAGALVERPQAAASPDQGRG